MTAITLPNAGIQAGYVEGESGWGAAMNRNMRLIDALMNLRVLDRDLNAPPGSPASGAVYIIGPTPTGDWAGKSNQLAVWEAGDDITAAWLYVVPKSGWGSYVVDEDVRVTYSGAAWVTGGSSSGDSDTVTAVPQNGRTGVAVIDLALGNYFTIALQQTLNLSFANLPGTGKGASLMIRINQGASHFVGVWPSSFKWSGTTPSLTAASNAVDILGLTTFDNGVTWMATLSKGHA